MKRVAVALKKVKKIADDWADITTTILPIGWVITCYDGHAKYLLSGQFVRFSLNLLVCCFISILLLCVGLYLSGLDLKPRDSDQSLIGRWKTLLIELAILLLITFYIAGK